MPNILITDYCNRTCAYCFAKGKVGFSQSRITSVGRNISLTNVKIILGFLKRSGHNIFSMLGGEPTLHPQFCRIVDMASESGFKVRVFSNGLMDKEKQIHLFRHNIDVILNINSPEETRAIEAKRLKHLFDRLGPNIHPGFNIYTKDFDFSFIFDLIDRFYMAREIRIGISQPIVGENNAHISPAAYRFVGRRLAFLAEVADQRNIRLNLDCGFALCMFGKTDLGKMVCAQSDLRFVCGPTIDIDPDLNLWSCFPLSAIMNRKLSDFENLNEINEFFKKIKKRFNHMGMFSKCRECRHRERGQCSGGCISHKIHLQPQLAQKMKLL
ncbi:MAG: radical SAM protein [bacterium]|nr:radical SAM protein [bacterium]